MRDRDQTAREPRDRQAEGWETASQRGQHLVCPIWDLARGVACGAATWIRFTSRF
jgi:hypothetical protein